MTPWVVAAEGGINYDKLLSQFGCQKISPELVARSVPLLRDVLPRNP